MSEASNFPEALRDGLWVTPGGSFPGSLYSGPGHPIPSGTPGSWAALRGKSVHPAPPFQGEPKLSAQIKAVSAECLGPPLDVATKNITKSLASLLELTEDGLGFSVRDPSSRDKVSRTVSLPTRGSTL